jgi:hypothetical protein
MELSATELDRTAMDKALSATELSALLEDLSAATGRELVASLSMVTT